jgi:aminoglycoside/choline kinase family phosphotransferase
MSSNPPTEAPAPGTTTLGQLLHADLDKDAAATIYRSAIAALLHWQLKQETASAQPLDATELTLGMESFVNDYIVSQRGHAVDAAQRKILDAAFAEISAQCLALPQIPVHGQFTLDQLQFMGESASATNGLPASALSATIAPSKANQLGPIGYDIVSLVRDPRRPWDEDFSLDITIRYWDMARKAGLPVGADFGEFYRGMEWVAVQRHLSKPALTSTPDLHAWIGFLHSACARYRELRPLSRLIEQVQGIEAASGYAFGRV